LPHASGQAKDEELTRRRGQVLGTDLPFFLGTILTLLWLFAAGLLLALRPSRGQSTDARHLPPALGKVDRPAPSAAAKIECRPVRRLVIDLLACEK
jgi:hypothetical protein